MIKISLFISLFYLHTCISFPFFLSCSKELKYHYTFFFLFFLSSYFFFFHSYSSNHTYLKLYLIFITHYPLAQNFSFSRMKNNLLASDHYLEIWLRGFVRLILFYLKASCVSTSRYMFAFQLQTDVWDKIKFTKISKLFLFANLILWIIRFISEFVYCILNWNPNITSLSFVGLFFQNQLSYLSPWILFLHSFGEASKKWDHSLMRRLLTIRIFIPLFFKINRVYFYLDYGYSHNG